MKDFRELEVWAKAHKLILEIYKVTKTFPSEELEGMANDIQRSGTAIPINIAKGCGNIRDRHLSYFLQLGMEAACELEYYFLLAHDLNFLLPWDYDRLATQLIEVKQLLSDLILEQKCDR